MKERNGSVNLHGQQKVEKCEEASEFLMAAMQGQPVQERTNPAGSVEQAWMAVMAWYQSQVDADRDDMEEEFDNIATQVDEGPKISMDLEYDGLYRPGSCGAAVDMSGGSTLQRTSISSIPGKCIPCWKVNDFDTIVRAKARLVARGNGQSAGVDNFENYSPRKSVAEYPFDGCHRVRVEVRQKFFMPSRRLSRQR